MGTTRKVFATGLGAIGVMAGIMMAALSVLQTPPKKPTTLFDVAWTWLYNDRSQLSVWLIVICAIGIAAALVIMAWSAISALFGRGAQLVLTLVEGPRINDELHYQIRVDNTDPERSADNVRAWVTITGLIGENIHDGPWGEYQIAWEPHESHEGHFERPSANIGPGAHDNIQFVLANGGNALIPTQRVMPVLTFPGAYIASVKVMANNARAARIKILFGINIDGDLIVEKANGRNR